MLLSLFPLSAWSQGAAIQTHSDWEVTVAAGGSFLGSRDYSTPVEGSSPDATRTVGLKYASGSQFRMGIEDSHWRHFGAALEYSYSNQPMTFSNLSDTAPSLSVGQLIHRFAYELKYYPLERSKRWRPYVFAGPGVSLFYIKGSGKDAAAAQGVFLSDPWKFAVNWGAAVKYLLRDPIAVSIQFNDTVTGVPAYGLPRTGKIDSDQYAPGFRPSGNLNNWLISAGLVYQWNDK